MRYLLAIALFLLTIHLGFQVRQTDFVQLVTGYFPFFLIYLFVYYKNEEWQNIRFFLFVSILLRTILVFSFPGLSDDIYRFVWDGRLLLAGVNPFDQLPAAYMAGTERIAGLDEALYQELNSPNYFTIYPPVCQAIFAGACWLCPQSVAGTALVMKVVFLFFEIGSIWLLVKLLRHFELPQKNALLYALNPLIILELVGNLHFEAAMVFFLLLAIYLLALQRWQWSAVAMAFSIASKLLPLLFLPFVIRRLGWKKSFGYFAITGLVVVLLFSPLLNSVFFSNFSDSLNLYFQKFEFNASVYYVLRWIGFQLTGFNLIRWLGPALAFCSALGILGLAFFEGNGIFSFAKRGDNRNGAKERKEKNDAAISVTKQHNPLLRSFAVNFKNADLLPLQTLPTMMLFAITWYLLLTTTVHPWYVSLPLVLSVFSGFRYAVLWSALIMLTYVNYSFEEYREVLWVVGLEYGLVVGFMIWELRRYYKAGV